MSNRLQQAKNASAWTSTRREWAAWVCLALCGALVLCALAIVAPSPARADALDLCSSGQAAGQCSTPESVAVDSSTGSPSSGDIYIADRGNQRVDVFDAAGIFLRAFGFGVANGADELQTCTAICVAGPTFAAREHLVPQSVAVDPSGHDVFVGEKGRIQAFSPQGEFQFMSGGGVLDGGATGTGDLTGGSTTVTSVVTTSRRFAVGQTLTGAGIPAATRIVNVNSGVITLSQAASASGAGVALTAPTPAANNPNNEVQSIALGGAPTGGTFSLVFGGSEGASGRDNIGASLTATTVSGSVNVSAAAQLDGTADLTAGSATISYVGAPDGRGNVGPGDVITGAGIPAGTTVVSSANGEPTELSAPATVSGVGVPLTFSARGTATVTAGSNIVTVSSGAGTFREGQSVSGPGIPAGTTITGVKREQGAGGKSVGTLELSANATAAASEVTLTAIYRVTLVDGEGVSGPGIPVGATVASVGADGAFTLSAPATASAVAVGVNAGVPYNASAAELQSMLEALPTVGAGNVAVSGAAGGPWAVEFKGARYADTNVIQMRAGGAGLTPTGTVAVSTTVEGASAAETCTKAELQAGDSCAEAIPGAGPGQLSTGSNAGEYVPPLAFDSAGHLWAGDQERIEQFSAAGVFLSEITLPGAGKVGGLAFDTDPSSPSFEDLYTLKPPVGEFDEVQQIRSPESGEYTLTFDGETTKPISAQNDSPEEAEAVLDALEALPSIGAHNVKVTSSATGLIFVEFVGALAATAVELTVSGVATVFRTGTQGEPGTPGVLTKRKPNGEAIETIDAAAPYGHPNAIGIDAASGELFVSDERGGSGATLLSYGPSGAQLEAFAAGEVIGSPLDDALAFGDSAQRLYAASSTESVESFVLPPPGPFLVAGSTKASEVKKIAASLCAEVNPEGESTTLHFQYITEKRFEEDGNIFGSGTVSTPETASIGSDFIAHKVCQGVSSLVPATAYRIRVVARNSNAPAGVEGETVSFRTLPPAAIDSTSASDVTAESATLEAEINPLGDATSYRFEYLTEAEYEDNLEEGPDGFSGAHAPLLTPVPDGPLGEGSADVAVSRHLQGLLPGTVYRFRAVVHNAVSEANAGPLAGPAHTFTTQLFIGTALPDHRAWEQVSPPDKRAALLRPIQEGGLIQVAASGEAIGYLASSATEAEPAGGPQEPEILSGRSLAGWASHDLAAPHSNGPSLFALSEGKEYKIFSSDLSRSILFPTGAFDPLLSAAASEQTAFLRTDFESGDSTAFCTSSCYRPVVTGCPKEEACPAAVEAAADVPPGTKFGDEGECPPRDECGPGAGPATPDLSHILTALKIGSSSGSYEWTPAAPPSESLRPLSILPDGHPSAEVGAAQGRGAISNDGSRVVLSGAGHLYMRYNSTEPQSAVNGTGECTEAAMACTVQMDTLQGGPGGGETPVAELQFSSADGSRVFFTDTQQLTPTSGTAPIVGDLYECHMVAVAGGLRCDLSDLTPSNDGENAAVQGSVIGASEDGAYVYFVADGVLAPGARPGNCQRGSQLGQCNLYLSHEGQITFVAALSGADHPDWGEDLGHLTARVSPSGDWLAFMSERPLTGYDNRDAVSAKPDEEVFLYHAPVGAGEAGTIVCASCNPTGARPRGIEYGTNEGTKHFNVPLTGGDGVWPAEQWIAANIPGWTPAGDGAYNQSRYLTNQGRLFFNSHDALVPQDTNRTEDVYQYEQPASGEDAPPNDSCTVHSPTYGSTSAGCVDLISSGVSPEESAFLDASENGDDVFFLTASKLAPSDVDTALDIYDARAPHITGEAVGFPEPIKPVECQGDACQSAVSPPEDLTPGSLSFNGPGNMLAAAPASAGKVAKKTIKCAKGRTLSDGKCVKPKSKHTKSKSNKKGKRAKKASHDRRTGR